YLGVKRFVEECLASTAPTDRAHEAHAQAPSSPQAAAPRHVPLPPPVPQAAVPATVASREEEPPGRRAEGGPPGETAGKASAKVFISYAHEPGVPGHADQMLDLADRLNADGLDCMVDQYVDNPPGGFPLWMEQQIREARFVLMVCTPAYYRRVMNQ